MTQLSRKQKYQELRDRLDEETTAAQAQPVKLQRLSRVDSGSHANKPLYPHDGACFSNCKRNAYFSSYGRSSWGSETIQY